MEDIYEDEYEDEFTTFGEDQSLDLNETQYQSIIDGLRQQCATVNPGIDNTDYFQMFVKEYLRLPDHEDLEDCTIYVDERLTEKDREKTEKAAQETHKEEPQKQIITRKQRKEENESGTTKETSAEQPEQSSG